MKVMYVQEGALRAVLPSPMQAQATKGEFASQSRCQRALPPWIAALTVLVSALPAHASEGPYSVLQRLSDVLVYIEESYVDPIDRSRLLEGATAGMVAELDPHSAYLNPAQFSEFLEDTQGEFAGLGVEVDFREDRVTVIATMPNSPAEAAGLRSGDRIVAVDSVPITGIRAEAIIRRMRGAAGTKVRLTVRREGVAEPIQLTVTRAMVSVPSVEGKLLDGNVAYVRLKSFQEGCYVELIERIAELNRSKHLSGIILDLRGNPGGLVSEAVAIADEFLDRGVIYSARHRGKVVETVESKSGGLLLNQPLVVLVGASTASSAEIVAGAWQDRGRATLVGEPTFGKGSVQNVIELRGGAGLLLTTLRYFTPNGRAIQARGLIPDIIVKSNDARPTLREADISGHLQTEGATPEERLGRSEKNEAELAARDEPDKNPTPPERTPLASVPSNPSRGGDPVLAKGYTVLLARVAR
ncbi:MAG TPA: S41 family peptidase [Polyangiaceae bacterium]|nr:S41 family peptidase [Polyangiaceae bacterium]